MFARASRIVCLCLVAAVWPLTAAQKLDVVPLVPPPAWRLESAQAFRVEAVTQWGGDPLIEREYGVTALERQIYRRGEAAVEVIVEEASDPSAAYGLFTFYQTENSQAEKDIELAVRGSAGTLMARGRRFLRFSPLSSAPRPTEEDFHALLIFAGGVRPLPDAVAGLPAPLPPSGLVPASEKYLIGIEAARRVLPPSLVNLIGFWQGAEAQAATYETGRERTRILAITYPTPLIARVRFGAMQQFLGINQNKGLESLYGKRTGSFVFLVLEAHSSETAALVMDKFKVSQSLSWNQRYPGNDSIVAQMAKLILANFVMVGILVGFAVAAGLLVYLSRRVAAKWFPQSSWGHPGEDIFIRLNLGP